MEGGRSRQIQWHRKVGESLNPRRILKQAKEGGGGPPLPHLNLLNGSKEPGGNLLFSARGFGNKGGGFTFKFSTRLEPPPPPPLFRRKAWVATGR